MPYHRVLFLSHARNGRLGQSSLLAEAFRACGHGVTHLDGGLPFEPGGLEVERGHVRPYLEAWRPGLVVLADGVSLAPEDRDLALSLGAAVCSVGRDGSVRAEGALAGRLAPFSFLPSVDEAYGRTELANFHDGRPVVACLDGAVGGRAEAVDGLLGAMRSLGVDARACCFGEGWPARFAPDRCSARLAYASRRALGLVLFADGDGTARLDPDAAVLLADGVPAFAPEGARVEGAGFAAEGAVRRYASAEGLAAALAEEAAGRDRGTEWAPAPRPAPLLSSPPLDGQVRAFVSSLEAQGALPGGSEAPARRVLLCGYYGTGNFGDEMILDHLAHDLDARCGLAVAFAVGAAPDAVWRDHGIESCGMGDHGRVAEELGAADAALVTAGLLFDQGARWTCGAGSLLGGAFATDLPGLAGLALAARACGTPLFFYGTGDGPLELAFSRDCVRLAGELGATFFARNRASFELVRSCGVPEGSAVEASDALYGLPEPDPAPGIAWGEERGVDLRRERAVVVALREWPGLPEGFERSFARALDLLASGAGCKVVFVDFGPEDAGIHRRVGEAMREKGACVFHGPVHGYGELLSLLSLAWAGFAMRLHCALVLARYGVPSVGVAYLPKVEALFRQTGQEGLLVPLGFSEEGLLAACRRLAAERDAIAAEVARRAAGQREALRPAQEAVEAALRGGKGPSERRFWPADGSRLQDAEARAAALEGEAARARGEAEAFRRRAELAEAELAELRGSTTLKVGRALVGPAAKVKDALRARRG